MVGEKKTLFYIVVQDPNRLKFCCLQYVTSKSSQVIIIVNLAEESGKEQGETLEGAVMLEARKWYI